MDDFLKWLNSLDSCSRFYIYFAFFLGLSGLLSWLKWDFWKDVVANFAYFFLFVAICLRLRELFKENWKR